MEKSKLIGFINRYFLAGNTDSAKLVVADKKLTTNFISADQNVIGEVTLNSFETGDAELGVYATSQLVKMLSAVDEKMDVTFGEVDKKKMTKALNAASAFFRARLAKQITMRVTPELLFILDDAGTDAQKTLAILEQESKKFNQ